MESILCGVDLGGTKLSAGLFNLNGQLIDKTIVYDHTDKIEDMVIEQIALLIKSLLKRNDYLESDLKGIGLGFPGHLRFEDGISITTSNLPGFENYPIRPNLQSFFKVPVIVDNDVNAQAFGEFKFGGGKGMSSMIFLTLSTGIGAGIIIDHKVFRGKTGTAGECGHNIIDIHSDLQCACGNYGCWMALSSGMALPHLYRKKIDAGLMPRHPSWNNDYSTVDGKFIKIGLDANDPISLAIMQDCANYNGVGLYNLFQSFNPQMIMLGGGLMNWGQSFFEKINVKFQKMVKNMLYDPIEIALCTLGSNAGLYGAAALALE